METQRTDPPRPRRADVAGSYDRGTEVYEALWSPVILPPAAALVQNLGLTGRCVVADVGAGTGALISAVRSAAPDARVVALDASAGMLRLARTRRGAAAVHANALALPLADATADAVILAYVLFHLTDPPRALAEAARVLRPGGRVAAISWAWERASRADTIWDQILTDAGVPPAPLRRVDAGPAPSRWPNARTMTGPIDDGAARSRCALAGARPSSARLPGGANRVRLSRVDAATGAEVLARAHSRLGQLVPQDYLWEGEIICAVATKAPPRD